MAEDAHRRKAAAAQDVGKATASAEAAAQKAWNDLDAAVREFINAAAKRGVRPKGALSKRWTVIIGDRPDVDSPYDELEIKPNGSWKLDAVWPGNSSRHSNASSSKPGVFGPGHLNTSWYNLLTEWLARQ